MLTIEFWTRIIIDVILLGVLGVGLESWLNYRFEKKLKKYEPLTAEEILKKENFLNSKRDVFFELIGLLSRSLASKSWTGENIPQNRIEEDNKPTESEINACYAKLNLYVENKEILESYSSLFVSDTSPFDIGNYIKLLRKDLGYGDFTMTPEKYPYIFSSRRETSKKV